MTELVDRYPHGLSPKAVSPDYLLVYGEPAAATDWISVMQSSHKGFDDPNEVFRRHPHPSVREAARNAVNADEPTAKLPDPLEITDIEAIDDLATQLAAHKKERERAVRQCLITAANEPALHQRVVLHLLLRLTALEEGQRRIETVDALAELAPIPLSDPTLESVLRAYLDAPSAELRRGAIAAVGELSSELGTDEPSDALKSSITASLSDDDPVVREWAADTARQYSMSLGTSRPIVSLLVDNLTDEFSVAQTSAYAIGSIARVAPDDVCEELARLDLEDLHPSIVRNELIGIYRNCASVDPAYADRALNFLPDGIIAKGGTAAIELFEYADGDQIDDQSSFANQLVDRLERTDDVFDAHIAGHCMEQFAMKHPSAVANALEPMAESLDDRDVSVIHAEHAVYRCLGILIDEIGSAVAEPFAEPIEYVIDADAVRLGVESNTREEGSVSLSYRILRKQAAAVASAAGLDCYQVAVETFPEATDAPPLDPTATARFLVNGADETVEAVRSTIRSEFPTSMIEAIVEELAELNLSTRWRRQARLEAIEELLPPVTSPRPRRQVVDAILSDGDAPNWVTRRRAVTVLEASIRQEVLPADEAISHLLPMTAEEHERVWAAVINAFMTAGDRAELSWESLIKLLHSRTDRAADSHGVAPAIARIGIRSLLARPLAVETLVDLLDHDSVAVRKRSLKALTDIAELDPSAIDAVKSAIQEQLDANDPNVRHYATECIERVRESR